MTPSQTPPTGDLASTGGTGDRSRPATRQQRRTLHRAAVADYAAATADTNPIHLDDSAARAAGLPAAVAHGMLSVAVALEAARSRPGEALSLRGVRFLCPAPVGADIAVDLRPDEEGWQFRVEAAGELVAEGAILRSGTQDDRC